MKKLMNKLGIGGVIAICLVAAGCLISGTFIIVEDFEFTAHTGFYFYRVDLTQEPDWLDHKDNIDVIDAVGVEFYISSTESGPVTFNAYIDDISGLEPDHVPTTASKIIDSFTVNPGLNQHITYAQSLGILTNITRLKQLVKSGKFDYFGTSTGNEGTTFKIDSGKVIVTFTASE